MDPIAIARLCRLNALELTKENVKSNCAPFDKHRAGFTIGEGCILFMMERESDAKKRNAKIFAEVKGYGASMDGFSLTDPHEEGLGMQLALIRLIMSMRMVPVQRKMTNMKLWQLKKFLKNMLTHWI